MGAWNNQENNVSTRFKLLVYYYPNEPKTHQTFWAFLKDEKKGTAIEGLTRRILQKLAFGRYKTAIFYDDGKEVERWEEGVKK